MCNLVLSDRALQESISYGQKDNWIHFKRIWIC
jgi:hypothetical protein